MPALPPAAGIVEFTPAQMVAAPRQHGFQRDQLDVGVSGFRLYKCGHDEVFFTVCGADSSPFAAQ